MSSRLFSFGPVSYHPLSRSLFSFSRFLGAIAGGVVGAVAGILILAAIFLIARKRSKRKKEVDWLTFGAENDHVNESSADAYLGSRPDLLKDEESAGHAGALEMSDVGSGTTHTNSMSVAGMMSAGALAGAYPYSSVDGNGSQQWNGGPGGSQSGDPYAAYYNQGQGQGQYYDAPQQGYGAGGPGAAAVPASFAAQMANSNSHSNSLNHSNSAGYQNQRPPSGAYESAYGGIGNSSNGGHPDQPAQGFGQGHYPPEGQWYSQGGSPENAPAPSGPLSGSDPRSSPILLPHMGSHEDSPPQLQRQASPPAGETARASPPTSTSHLQKPQLTHQESSETLPDHVPGRLGGGGLHLVNPDE